MQSSPSPASAVSAPPGVDAPPALYTVGTLRYTKPALFVTMAWLLWGDFCFMVMESVVPTLLPLKLRQLDAPNWIIALFLTTIPSLLNATVCPAVSFLSDRHRGPRGRRIPFILHTIPFLCGCLALIGLSPLLARWAVGAGWIQNEALLTLTLLGVFATGFQFFNMFVGSVYYYLFNDVVPARFLGRFMALFRVVGVSAQAAYSFFVFPHAETHFPEIFAAASVLYGVVFLMMCRKVKEGEYPPVPPRAESNRRSHLDGIKTFVRECYTSRLYWLFYLFTAFHATAMTITVFQLFFAQSLGITLQQFGWFTGGVSILVAILLVPCGWITDRIGPLTTVRIAITGLAVTAPLWLVLTFGEFPAERIFVVWCAVGAIITPVTALFYAAELPAYMTVLPKDRYGQFSSANALFRSLATLVGGLLGGSLIDVMKRWTGPEAAYRYIPFWSALFFSLSAICLWLLHRESRRRSTTPEVGA